MRSLVFAGRLAAITLQPPGIINVVAFGTAPVFWARHKALGCFGLITALAPIAPLIVRKGTLGTQPIHTACSVASGTSERAPASRLIRLRRFTTPTSPPLVRLPSAISLSFSAGPRARAPTVKVFGPTVVHTPDRHTLQVGQLRFNQHGKTLKQSDRGRLLDGTTTTAEGFGFYLLAPPFTIELVVGRWLVGLRRKRRCLLVPTRFKGGLIVEEGWSAVRTVMACCG